MTYIPAQSVNKEQGTCMYNLGVTGTTPVIRSPQCFAVWERVNTITRIEY